MPGSLFPTTRRSVVAALASDDAEHESVLGILLGGILGIFDGATPASHPKRARESPESSPLRA